MQGHYNPDGESGNEADYDPNDATSHAHVVWTRRVAQAFAGVV